MLKSVKVSEKRVHPVRSFPGCTYAKVGFKGPRCARRLEKADTKESFASFFLHRRSPLAFKPVSPCNIPPETTGWEGPAKGGHESG
jgi:hypothetical protein